MARDYLNVEVKKKKKIHTVNILLFTRVLLYVKYFFCQHGGERMNDKSPKFISL